MFACQPLCVSCRTLAWSWYRSNALSRVSWLSCHTLGTLLMGSMWFAICLGAKFDQWHQPPFSCDKSLSNAWLRQWQTRCNNCNQNLPITIAKVCLSTKTMAAFTHEISMLMADVHDWWHHLLQTWSRSTCPYLHESERQGFHALVSQLAGQPTTYRLFACATDLE